MKHKLIRTATIPGSLDFLLKGQLGFLNKEYEVIAVSGHGAHLENVASREGVRTVPINMQRQISPFKDSVSLWKLFRLFKKEKPLIVHSITPKAGLLSMTAAYFAGVPIRIHTFTGLIFPSKTGFFQKILILMDKILCAFATNIYPEGQGVKQDLIRFKITNKPLKIIANGNVNGIDTTYFSSQEVLLSQKQQLKEKLGIKENDFIFIFVGRLVRDKGINELVAAFNQLSKENCNIKLLLVGPEEPDLDPLNLITLQILEQNSAMKQLGFQSDVRSYFAIADALVFPSYREGFPNVVLQAGAMGLPVIATNISGCNEIIIEGTNGILIPVKKAQAIYNAMKELVQNTTLKMKMQQNARTMIVSRYQQQLVWDALLMEYKQLVDRD